jgi:nucleoside-diphosphate-sugar epimerase
MPSEFAIIGLGKIGGSLAKQAVEKGYRVVGFTRRGVPADLLGTGVLPGQSNLAMEMVGSLSWAPEGTSGGQVLRFLLC